MKTSNLLFVGIKGSAIALNRTSGEQVWTTHLKGSDFVNVSVEDGRVLATCYGEIFCLDPLTGDALLRGRGSSRVRMIRSHTLLVPWRVVQDHASWAGRAGKKKGNTKTRERSDTRSRRLAKS
jgi:outer membrane protein assembly factor BamB